MMCPRKAILPTTGDIFIEVCTLGLEPLQSQKPVQMESHFWMAEEKASLSFPGHEPLVKSNNVDYF